MKIGLPSDLNHTNYPGYNTMGICGVVAVAVASGSNFGDVRSYYKSRKRGNWKGVLYTSEILEGMKHFGVKLENLNVGFRKFFGMPFHALVNHISVNDPHGVYVVLTTGHIQVVSGRTVVDQGGVKDIINYHFKRKHVTDVYRVVSTNNPRPATSYERAAPKIYKKSVTINARRTRKNSDLKTVVSYIVGMIKNGDDRDTIVTGLIDNFNYKYNSAMVYYYKVKKEYNNG